MKVKQLIKLLEEKGWSLDRIKGSHHIMVKPGFRSIPIPIPIPIPFQGNVDIDPKFIRLVEKQAGEKLL